MQHRKEYELFQEWSAKVGEHAETQQLKHNRLAVAAHNSVKRTLEAKRQAMALYESIQASGLPEAVCCALC